MKVRFLPQEITLDIASDQTVMQLAHANNLPIKSVCNGVPSCAECRVRVVDGEGNVLPPSNAELSLIGTGYFLDQRRLSCQLICFGDITVDLSEQLEKQTTDAKKRPQGSAARGSDEPSFAVAGSLLEEASPEEIALPPKLEREDGSNSGEMSQTKKRRRSRRRR